MSGMQNPGEENHTYTSLQQLKKLAKQTNTQFKHVSWRKHFWPVDTNKTNHSASWTPVGCHCERVLLLIVS